MFLFEVIYQGETKMFTHDKNCVYPKDVLLRMMEAGYTFKLNGKSYRP